ncbi:PH domain-containing protein [Lacisediminihabitans changchengi]|uniref:PH domain-containing protein n=1 Tax=Lacisediminihabitans changchengi TaxID=2787634 RepID=A0A934SNW2_9MICO|nr:PH domain-containing protein [Lacisediminihabitans changchengi]MBK4348477.1 PH domain-containing protein [Lacisediminihabitans changchengi]
MTDSAARQEPQASVPVTSAAGRLADGQWHRLHPASPLLRGGIVLIAVLGFVVSNLRERLVELFLPRYGGGDQGDPVEYVLAHGIVLQVLGVIAGVLLVLIAGFYVSWRMHSFRITNEVVEVRSGVLFRTSRKARLDRIQGINIVRPFFARLFGASKLEINQAGHDANVQLSYLGTAAADELRREILRLASGTRAAAKPMSQTTGQTVIDRRVNEFMAPEHDPGTPPESIVNIHLGRLIGSMLLGNGMIIAAVFIAAVAVWIARTGNFFILVFALPSALGFVSYYVRRFTKSLRYSISSTPDGVRVGFGLLSTTSETLPPGRIHSIEVSQSLLWRPFGWWEVRVNRAGHSNTRGADNQANTTLLPVGNLAEVTKVLELLLPDLVGSESVAMIERGLRSRGGADGFENSPLRAAWLRPLSWRRNGFLVTPGSFVLRTGAIWRKFVVVPQPRLQSVALSQGPVLRMLRLADIHLHTVAGPIRAHLDAVDQNRALAFFETVATAAVASQQSDTSHRWRSGEEPA